MYIYAHMGSCCCCHREELIIEPEPNIHQRLLYSDYWLDQSYSTGGSTLHDKFSDVDISTT